MSLVTYGSADVLECEVHAGQRGAAWAYARLEADAVPTGQATLAAADGISLAMTVIAPQSGRDPFRDSVHVRLVAGAGGLSLPATPAAFDGAQLRDPLGALLAAAGEVQSPTISDAVLSTTIAHWTLHAVSVMAALNDLAAAAGLSWRVLADGTIWFGLETWPAVTLPATADVLKYYPAEQRYVIGVETPALLPGVALSDLGINVGAVDHFVDAEKVRTWARAA